MRMPITPQLEQKARELWQSIQSAREKRGKAPLKALKPVELLSLSELAREISSRLKSSQSGNVKLGIVYTWSLLAVHTCPWRTAACEGPCYARKMQARGDRQTTWLAWYRCWKLSLHPLFGEALKLSLMTLPEGLLRIHVSGDFYSVQYLRDWLDALELSPHLKPFAFTRSWRGQDFLAVLAEYGWPKWVLASTDADTGPAPSQMRVAAMSDVTKASVLKGAKAPKLACPEQTTVQDTCSSCGRCPMAKVGPNGLVMLPNAAKIGVEFLTH